MDNLHHLCIGFDNWTQVGFDSEDPKFSFGARQLEKGAREAAPLRDLRDSRTSPRSKKRQAQHRSMSQERAAMSSSWSKHPAMWALNFQAISIKFN